jgi:hypothetical protein
VIQSGRPEELVGAPADDYVADFVRDVAKANVLTLRWVMRPRTEDDSLDGPSFPPDTLIRSAVHVAAATDKPIRVVDGERLLGIVDRVQILEAIAGRDEDDDRADLTEGTSGRPKRVRIEAVNEPTEGTAELLAGAAVDPNARPRTSTRR